MPCSLMTLGLITSSSTLKEPGFAALQGVVQDAGAERVYVVIVPRALAGLNGVYHRSTRI